MNRRDYTILAEVMATLFYRGTLTKQQVMEFAKELSGQVSGFDTGLFNKEIFSLLEDYPPVRKVTA